MKASSFHYKTQKEAPKDAELISHKLMIRTNMIKTVGFRYLFMDAPGIKDSK